MKEATYQIMRDEPEEFENLLVENGILLVRKDDKPFAVVFDVGEDTVDTVVRAVSQFRAQMAVSKMRLGSRVSGLDQLTSEEIQEEIRALRSQR